MKVSYTLERCLVLYWCCFPASSTSFIVKSDETAVEECSGCSCLELKWKEGIFRSAGHIPSWCLFAVVRVGTNEVLFTEPVFPVSVTLPSGIGDRWHAGALFTILITSASAHSRPSSDQSEATFTPPTQVAPSDIFPSCYNSVPRAGGNWSAAYTRQKQIWRTVAAGEPRTPCQINEHTFTIKAYAPTFPATVLSSACWPHSALQYIVKPALSPQAKASQHHIYIIVSWLHILILRLSEHAHKFHLQKSPEGVSWRLTSLLALVTWVLSVRLYVDGVPRV